MPTRPPECPAFCKSGEHFAEASRGQTAMAIDMFTNSLGSYHAMTRGKRVYTSSVSACAALEARTGMAEATYGSRVIAR